MLRSLPTIDLSSAAPLRGRTVLQVLPALSEGGVERGTVEIVGALADAGAVPLVASAGGRMVPAVTRAGGRHLTLPLMTKDPLNILLNARRLRRLMEREGGRAGACPLARSGLVRLRGGAGDGGAVHDHLARRLSREPAGQAGLQRG